VADLTLAEVREQGAAAKKAQQGAEDFHATILAQQEGLARQIALLQRAGAAGSGSAALEAVVRELAEELRMQRSDVAKQLEEERFLLHQDIAALSDLEGRVLQALDARTLATGADVARLGVVVGEQLAALDAHSGANADAVAAAVAASLKRAGVSATGIQEAVREELSVTAHLRCACAVPLVARMMRCSRNASSNQGFAQGLKSLEQAVIANQDRHAARSVPLEKRLLWNLCRRTIN
jgi:hypothetical protein